jgi:ribosome biogenesis protein Tsr3
MELNFATLENYAAAQDSADIIRIQNNIIGNVDGS